MLQTYSLTKAKRALCDVAQLVADLLGCASRVPNILTTVMTRIVVDKSTTTLNHIRFVFYHNIKVNEINEINICLDNYSDLNVHALYYANELFVPVRFSFQKLLQTRLIRRNNTMFML